MDQRYRQRFEKFVGVEKPPTLIVSSFEATEFVATRVEWEQTDGGHPTQFERANGYMLCLQRRPLPAQTYWADGIAMPLPALQRGQFLLLDLNVQHGSLVPSAVDCISVLVSGKAVSRFQEEHGLPATGLSTPLCAAHEDEVVRHLCEALLPAIEQPHEASHLWSDHIALALLARLAEMHGIEALPMRLLHGGLAPWQERRAKEMLISHLDGRVGLEALAAECQLSRAHFARAFKASTGFSPLRWLGVQRIARAKMLLTDTELSLEQVAESCGFVDSSHLSRAFSQAMGVSPGAWRRLRRF